MCCVFESGQDTPRGLEYSIGSVTLLNWNASQHLGPYNGVMTGGVPVPSNFSGQYIPGRTLACNGERCVLSSGTPKNDIKMSWLQ